MEKVKLKLKHSIYVTYVELLRKWFGIRESELVSQKWKECDLVPDGPKGWEGSKVLLKEKHWMEECGPISRHLISL